MLPYHSRLEASTPPARRRCCFRACSAVDRDERRGGMANDAAAHHAVIDLAADAQVTLANVEAP